MGLEAKTLKRNTTEGDVPRRRARSETSLPGDTQHPGKPLLRALSVVDESMIADELYSTAIEQLYTPPSCACLQVAVIHALID